MLRPRRRTARDAELSTKPAIRKKLLDVFKDVDKGYIDQNERADDIVDYWELFNCQLGDRQFYQGNSQIFVPIINNAVGARKTRFTNQIFPQTGRYVEVITENGDIPHATMSLLEHYVRRAKLRTQVVPALMVAGDVEGQYSVYVDWRETKRHVVSKVEEPVKVGGLEHPDLGGAETIQEEVLVDAGPTVEVLADADLLVLPATVDDIEEAIEAGGSVTVIRRWSKSKIKQMIDDGDIVESVGEALLKTMAKKETSTRTDTAKDLASAAGIKASRSGKVAQVYETWTRLKVDGEMRLCRAYYGGEDQILGAKLCPYWCDKVPVITGAVEKLPGVLKGQSMLKAVQDMQILANDSINEAADTAHFSAMPIIMTDPEKNPRVGTMVLGLAAVWQTNPNDTKFAQFPELWKHGFEIVASCKAEIFQTLSVNPSMLPQQTGSKGGKRNQAEIAMEQQVDVLTTADAVTNIEETILSPMLVRFAEYDHQFRDDAIMIRSFGEMGLRAQMESVPPIQMDRRFEFRWFGVEAARNAAQVQQQIAGVNVLKGIPPQMLPGYKLDMSALAVQLAENMFGPRLAPLVLVSLKAELSVDPELENQMLVEGFDVQAHAMDDDQAHLQAHMQLMQNGGADPHGTIRSHIMKHMQQLQMKQASQAQAQQQGGQGGGGGGPQPGAQPGTDRGMKGPPGAMHQDQMARAGAPGMPRKT